MHPVLKFILAIAGIAIVVTIAVGAVEVLDGSGDGPTPAERQAQIEHRIKTGIERKAAQAGGRARVRNVTCVPSDSSHYECVARTEIAGEVASVPVSVTSDDEHFIWHLGEASEGTTATAGSSTEHLPSPESLAWTQVTCREVKRAFTEQDNEWLATAGEAVAVQAVATRPDAEPERLAVAGARNLIVICRRASNSSYEPYAEAGTALLTGRNP